MEVTIGFSAGKKGSEVHIPFPAGLPLARSETALAEGCGEKSCLEKSSGQEQVSLNGKEHWKHFINSAPVCTLRTFHPDTSIFLITGVNKC